MQWRKSVANIVAPWRSRHETSGGLPDFLVVGTKRGGSTSLYEWICAHPDVVGCRSGKGTHYFDVNHGRGWQWFTSRFERVSPEQRTGEGSPYYMFHPLAARRIADELPGVRLIAVLREPVSRAWSQYQYEQARGMEDLSFDEALDREDERLAGEEERLVTDPAYESFHHRHHAYLRRGHYAEQLSRLVDLCGADRLLVLQSEALFAEPHGELAKVWAFLGLPAVRLGELAPRHIGETSPIPEHIAARLEAYYRPRNAELYRLPAVSFRWPDPAPGDPAAGDSGSRTVPA